MGSALLKMHKAKAESDRLGDRHRPGDDLNPQERKALRTMRREAQDAGSFLTSNGKGGLAPSAVLGRMRKTGFRCERCKELGNQKNGGLGMHHRGGIPATAALSRLGHKNIPKNYESICESCHNKAHQKARAAGVDSSQVLPVGDKGTDRDHGDKPLAQPEA